METMDPIFQENLDPDQFFLSTKRFFRMHKITYVFVYSEDVCTVIDTSMNNAFSKVLTIYSG